MWLALKTAKKTKSFTVHLFCFILTVTPCSSTKTETNDLQDQNPPTTSNFFQMLQKNVQMRNPFKKNQEQKNDDINKYPENIETISEPNESKIIEPDAENVDSGKHVKRKRKHPNKSDKNQETIAAAAAAAAATATAAAAADQYEHNGEKMKTDDVASTDKKKTDDEEDEENPFSKMTLGEPDNDKEANTKMYTNPKLENDDNPTNSDKNVKDAIENFKIAQNDKLQEIDDDIEKNSLNIVSSQENFKIAQNDKLQEIDDDIEKISFNIVSSQVGDDDYNQEIQEQMPMDVTTISEKNTEELKKPIKKSETKRVPFEYGKSINAHIFCTFSKNLVYMYQKIKENFVKNLCQVIVFGTPLIIRNHRVLSDTKIENELMNIRNNIDTGTFLIVIMQHNSYETWSKALDEVTAEVAAIIDFVTKYKIDGIQFSNLQPTAYDQLDTDMLCKIILFFENLIKSSYSQNHKLMIGLTLNSYGQSMFSSFKTFEVLNHMVTWYSLNTISMFKCNLEHLTGTSPLRGDISLENSLKELMKTDIQMNKVIVGIQLYPNKVNVLKPSSYNQMCSTSEINFNTWCASQPNDLYEKGKFVRLLQVWGVQLYYIESDDFNNKCQCGKFPMIRGLLRGMVNKKMPANCDKLSSVKNQPSACNYDSILDDLELVDDNSDNDDVDDSNVDDDDDDDDVNDDDVDDNDVDDENTL